MWGWRQELNPLLGNCGAALTGKSSQELLRPWASDLRCNRAWTGRETEVQKRPGAWLRSHCMLAPGRAVCSPPWGLFSHQ